VSTTLKVTQESLLNPAGILRGTLDVVVDRKSVGSIKWHEAIEVPVNPDITPCKSAKADTRAELRPSTRPRKNLSPSDATEGATRAEIHQSHWPNVWRSPPRHQPAPPVP
jgi:hypothetical protein